MKHRRAYHLSSCLKSTSLTRLSVVLLLTSYVYNCTFYLALYISYKQFRWSLQWKVHSRPCHSTSLVFQPERGPATFRSVIYRDPIQNSPMEITTENVCPTCTTAFDLATLLNDPDCLLQQGPVHVRGRPFRSKQCFLNSRLWPIRRPSHRLGNRWVLHLQSQWLAKISLVSMRRVTPTLLATTYKCGENMLLNHLLTWAARSSVHWPILLSLRKRT